MWGIADAHLLPYHPMRVESGRLESERNERCSTMTLHDRPCNGSLRRSPSCRSPWPEWPPSLSPRQGPHRAPRPWVRGPKLQKLAEVSQGVATSGDFAGYRAAPYGGLSSAGVAFTIPAVACTTEDLSNGALLADGLNAENSRTGQGVYATVQAVCANGSGPSYTLALGTPAGTFTEPGANPGDTVVISVFQTGTLTWVEIADQTSGVYWIATDGAASRWTPSTSAVRAKPARTSGCPRSRRRGCTMQRSTTSRSAPSARPRWTTCRLNRKS